MNILIPNATGPTNIGDQAILLPAIELLKKNFPHAHITLHTTTPHLYKKQIVDRIDSHLYNWAIFEDKSSKERIMRLAELFAAYYSLRLGLPLMARGKLRELLMDYLEADLIVFIGGGYFRSKKKLSQSLNLFMISSSFHFSKLTSATTIVFPMSFGPFAYQWHEQYTARLLKDLKLVSARESFSFQAIKRYKVPNTILSSDTALLLNAKTKRIRTKGFTIGFTIRTWFGKPHQRVFERNFIAAVSKFAKETKCVVQPILQVVGDIYGESDEQITQRIIRALEKRNIPVLKVHKILTFENTSIYSQIDLLLGMRMHSNILAAVHGVPFVAISYEHKTEGIAKDLGMENYVIKCEDVNEENLYKLLKRAYFRRVTLNKTINTSLNKIKKRENERWDKAFQKLLPDFYQKQYVN